MPSNYFSNKLKNISTFAVVLQLLAWKLFLFVNSASEN